jgi:hypothetical protein
MDLDPIQQLQNLLDDRSKVLEKISSIHSVLGSLGRRESSTPDPAAPVTEAAPQPSGDDQVYGRLQRTLRDMQTQIEQRVQPIARQVVDLQVARLREQSVQDQAALNECLTKIDRCILNCGERMEEYKKRHNLLTALNQRLANLGALPEPMPDDGLAASLSDTIESRLKLLHNRAKL